MGVRAVCVQRGGVILVRDLKTRGGGVATR